MALTSTERVKRYRERHGLAAAKRREKIQRRAAAWVKKNHPEVYAQFAAEVDQAETKP